MQIVLDKLLDRGKRPGYGTIWRIRDLPELQLVQGLYGGGEWSIVLGGDGFFFLPHSDQPVSQLSQSVLSQVGQARFDRKKDALDAVAEALRH